MDDDAGQQPPPPTEENATNVPTEAALPQGNDNLAVTPQQTSGEENNDNVAVEHEQARQPVVDELHATTPSISPTSPPPPTPDDDEAVRDTSVSSIEPNATTQSVSDEREITSGGPAVDIPSEQVPAESSGNASPPPTSSSPHIAPTSVAHPEPEKPASTTVTAAASRRASVQKVTSTTSSAQRHASQPGLSPSSPNQPGDGEERSPRLLDGESATSLETPHNSGEKEIVPFFSIGAQSGASNALHFLDNNTILYGCGAHFVIHNIEQKFQKFIPLPRTTTDVAAVALDLQHHLLAFAEAAAADEGRQQPTVYIYDVVTIKRRKTMCVGDGKSLTQQWLAFTPDGKMLATLGGAPDYMLQLWNWEKSRIYAQARIGVLANEVRPRSSTEFLVFGPKVLRIYLLRETGLKLIGQTEKFRNVNILSAEWCGDLVLVSVEHGKTFLWNPREDTMVAFHDRVAKQDQAFIGVPAHLRESMHTDEMTTTKSAGGSKSQRNASMAAQAAAASTADERAQEQNIVKDLFYLHGASKCLRLLSDAHLACVVGHHGVQLWRKKLISNAAAPSTTATATTKTGSASVRASKTTVRSAVVVPAAQAAASAAFEFELVEQYKISQDEKKFINRQKITMLSLSPDGQRIVCRTDKGQIYLCEPPKPETTTTSPTTAGKGAAQSKPATLKQSAAVQERRSSSQTSDSPTEVSRGSPGGVENSAAAQAAMANFDRHPIREMQHMSTPFHSGHIASIDVAVKKPILATASDDDNSVRIWNFQTRTVEVIKIFEEPPLSVAVHPSGHYVLVGFAERLVLMYLMCDDLRALKEFSIRGCRECAFAHGGHLFAALNGNVIQIYSAIQFENVASCRGHNSRVKGLKWARSDQTLVTCSQDGAVYEWDVHTGRRVSESVLKAVNYNAVAVSPDSLMIYAVGSDMMLREIRDSQIQREIPQETVLTSLCLSPTGRVMAAGTETGMIRMYRYPSLPPDWWEYVGHRDTVKLMRLTNDENYLITVGSEGSLMIWLVQDADVRGISRRRPPALTYSQEVLITRSDLEEKNARIIELSSKLDEIRMESEFQLRLKDTRFNELMRNMTDEYNGRVENLKRNNQRLTNEKDQLEFKHADDLAKLVEKYEGLLMDVESQSNKQLMAEFEKYQQLMVQGQKCDDKYQAEISRLNQEVQKSLDAQTTNYEMQMAVIKRRLAATVERSQGSIEERETMIEVFENDIDREVEEMRSGYEQSLWELKDANMKLKGESGIMKKRFSSLMKEIQDQQTDAQRVRTDLHRASTTNKALQKDITNLKKDIEERDTRIREKEKKIYDLKKRNQELEKFKFVLDFRIKDLKREIEPREEELEEKKERIEEIEESVNDFQDTIESLRETTRKDVVRLQHLDNEKKHVTFSLRTAELYLNRFQGDLQLAIESFQQPKVLRRRLKEIHTKFVEQSLYAFKPADPNLMQTAEKEIKMHRDYLGDMMKRINKFRFTEKKTMQKRMWEIMQDNLSLLQQIERLRTQLVEVNRRVGVAEAANRGPRRLVKEYNMDGLQDECVELKKESESRNATIKLLQDRLAHMMRTLRPSSAGSDLTAPTTTIATVPQGSVPHTGRAPLLLAG